METTVSAQTTKPVFRQDLWTELSSISLFLGEITWASVMFCTFFNRPLEYLRIAGWLALFGFVTYFGERILTYLTSKRWLIMLLNGAWIATSLLLFTQFVVYTNSSLDIWQMLIDPLLNLNRQPVLQSQLWQMLVLVLLLRRGFTLASSNANAWRAVRSFQVGMLMFFFFGFTTTWENFAANLLPFLFYLLFAITALTTSRLATLSSQPGYKFSGFTKSWFTWILVLTVALIVVGSGIGWITGVGYVAITEWLLRVAYGLGISVVVLLFSPLIALIGLLLPWLNKMLASISGKQFGLEQLEFIQSLNNPDPVKAAQVNDIMNQIITISLITALVITIVIIIISARRRTNLNRKVSVDNQVSRSAKPKKPRFIGFTPDFFRTRLDQARRWLASARIRRIYQELMDYCTKLDNPRLPAFTPHEFLPELVKLFPEHESEVTLLTDIYQRVRYGEIPETLEELENILHAWERVKINARQKVKERRNRLRRN
jgi:hypothetical protein